MQNLFDQNFLASLTEEVQIHLLNWLYLIQNSRHYKKISGDEYGGFDLIRSPMYKYSKLVKEKFFNDNYMAFYWMIFKQQNDIEALLKN